MRLRHYLWRCLRELEKIWRQGTRLIFFFLYVFTLTERLHCEERFLLRALLELDGHGRQ